MTSKDESVSKIEEVSVALLIVHDVSELFVCVESALSECESLVAGIVGSDDSLHEQILLFVEDECCSE